jgi:hypothetical protein
VISNRISATFVCFLQRRVGSSQKNKEKEKSHLVPSLIAIGIVVSLLQDLCIVVARYMMIIENDQASSFPFAANCISGKSRLFRQFESPGSCNTDIGTRGFLLFPFPFLRFLYDDASANQLTFLGALSSSAGYHFLAWSAEAGTSRVDFPNCLVVGLADMLTLSGGVWYGVWRG